MSHIRHSLALLATCIGFLMAGLIGVQAYWVYQNLQLQERQLAQDLQRTLANVAHDLECREINELMAEGDPINAEWPAEPNGLGGQRAAPQRQPQTERVAAQFVSAESPALLYPHSVWSPLPQQPPLPPAPPEYTAAAMRPRCNPPSCVAESSSIQTFTQVWIHRSDSGEARTVVRVASCATGLPLGGVTASSVGSKSRPKPDPMVTVGSCCSPSQTNQQVGCTQIEVSPELVVAHPLPAPCGLRPMEANHGIALTETDSNGATRQVVVFSSEMRQQAYDYREQVQRVVKELVASRMPIRRRVDSTSVHRLLRRHLAEAGLATELEFAFVINDPSECQRLAGDSAQLSSADQIVSAPLFPDRLETGRSATLSVGFWGTRRTVWANMAGLLGLTALLVAGVGLGFVYTLRTIRRQKRIDQMKDDFLDNLTHELKTPVATLRLAGEALAAQPALGPDRVTRYANIVSHESQRLQTHLERVLTLAEQERGGVRLEPTWVDLAQLAEEVAGCYRLRATEKGGTLEVKAVGDPKLLTAWVDRHLMTSVLENLLDNALKYNEKEPRISVTLSRIPGAVQLSVCDNGIGMKPETLRHAFDKFYRQHSGNRHTYKGFGIGLSLCRQVVEAHGGKIMAESQPGVGSTFCVHLPSPA